MSAFFEYAIIVLVILLVLLLLSGMIATVLKTISFLTKNETDDMSEQEKLENRQQKNIIWIILGVLLGASLFGE